MSAGTGDRIGRMGVGFPGLEGGGKRVGRGFLGALVLGPGSSEKEALLCAEQSLLPLIGRRHTRNLLPMP